VNQNLLLVMSLGHVYLHRETARYFCHGRVLPRFTAGNTGIAIASIKRCGSGMRRSQAGR
jgi:hypothetical protein